MATIGTDIDFCIELLNKNELVAIPTETVYGLAGNGLSSDAVAKIFEAKKRPFFDPLILHTDTLLKAKKFIKDIPEKAQLLADHFWPGPLTLILPRTDTVPDIVCSGLPTVGVRIPAHPVSLGLLQKLDYPLAAPSANPFKYISPTTALHVKEQLNDRIQYILDGGSCSIGLESTIIGFENDQPIVYRFGGLEIEAIEKVVGTVKTLTHNEVNPSAPGMLKLHYAPTKKMQLIDIANLNKFDPKRTGVITFTENPEGFLKYKILSPSGNINEAANSLFAAMRELDKTDVELIIAEKFPEIGLGRAINDRLNRACSK